MSKDYKNRIPAYRQRKRRRLRQIAIMAASAALFASLAGVGVYRWIRSGSDGTTLESTGDGKAAKAAAKLAEVLPKAEHPPLPEPRFTFYKILPDREVILSESAVKSAKRDEELGKASTTAYVVQAGAFPSQADAEQLQRRLAELRVNARLELITLDHTRWYRVKLGPYGSLADADKVRQHLRAHHIDSVVQKAKLAVR